MTDKRITLDALLAPSLAITIASNDMRELTQKESAAIIDGLLLKIESLEIENSKLFKNANKLNITNYMYSQFIFTNRNELISDFSEFVFENMEECAYSHGLDNITKPITEMLEDLSEIMSLGAAQTVNSVIDKINKGQSAEEPTDRFAMGTPSVDHAGENKEDK